jgi:hypothetical protein
VPAGHLAASIIKMNVALREGLGPDRVNENFAGINVHWLWHSAIENHFIELFCANADVLSGLIA